MLQIRRAESDADLERYVELLVPIVPDGAFTVREMRARSTASSSSCACSWKRTAKALEPVFASRSRGCERARRPLCSIKEGFSSR
jgi:hypothetical protein